MNENDLVRKIMNQFKDNLIKAGEIAVKEVFYIYYAFEIENITFNVDYSDTDDAYEFYNCTITFSYGNPQGDTWYRGNSISINNIQEYNLDDINYLYGLFYGYFSALELEME